MPHTIAGPADVVRSVLSPSAVAGLVTEAYDVGRPVDCRLAMADDNDHYDVRCGAGRARWVVRVYRHAKYWLADRGDYRFELEWLRWVHGRGGAVAAPLARRDGDLLGSVDAPEGRRLYAMFPHAGAWAGLPGAQDARRLGLAVAGLHRASAGFTSPYGRLTIDAAFTLYDPTERVERFLADTGQDRPGDVRLLREVVERAAPSFESLARDAATWGVIGGDCHSGNHLVAADGRLTLIDFDLCGWGHYAYDCATLCWALHHMGAEADGLWPAYLEGYESARPLVAAERSAIPWFAAARHVWLMGAHTASAPHTGEAGLGRRCWDHAFALLREHLAHAERAA